MRTAMLVFGFVVAGAAGALFALLVLPPPAPEPPAAGTPDRLEARLIDLEAEVERLKDLVRAERTAPPVAGEPPGGIPAAGLAPEDAARIEEAVEDVIARRDREEKRRREEEAAALQAEKDQKWLDRWTKELDLTEAQREELGKQLARRREALAEHRRKLVAKGPDITQQEREVLDQELRDIGRILDDELRKILTPDQYEKMMSFYRRGRR